MSKKCRFIKGKKVCRETNPFKLWGAWVGAGIGILFLNILPTGYSDESGNLFYLDLWRRLLNLSRLSLSAILLSIILGFLIGYVLTILYRRFKK